MGAQIRASDCSVASDIDASRNLSGRFPARPWLAGGRLVGFGNCSPPPTSRWLKRSPGSASRCASARGSLIGASPLPRSGSGEGGNVTDPTFEVTAHETGCVDRWLFRTGLPPVYGRLSDYLGSSIECLGNTLNSALSRSLSRLKVHIKRAGPYLSLFRTTAQLIKKSRSRSVLTIGTILSTAAIRV